MTRFSLLFIFCLSVLFSSCSKDSDDIVGTYKIVSLKTERCNDPEDNFAPNLDKNGCALIDAIQVCIEGTFSFTANGTFSSNMKISAGTLFSQTITASGTYTLENGKLTICDQDGCEISDAKLSKNKLTITVPDDDGCVTTLVGEKK